MEERKEELLRRYLDGELAAEEEQEALHIIADDEDLRAMLRFEQQIKSTDFSSYTVPEGFSNNVMAAIDAKEQATEQVTAFEKIGNWIGSLFEPREFQFRPAFAGAMLLAIIVLAGLPYFANWTAENRVATNNIDSASVEQVSDGGEQVWTRFVYIDKEATSVSVAGDFSDWNPIELTKKNLNGQQVWTGLVPMDRGEHRYMFVKNGEQWVTDPLAPVQQDDGFGNKNAVIYL